MMLRHIVVLIVLCLILIAVVVSYNMFVRREIRIIATTTTSLYATGLLDELESEIKKIYPYIDIDFVPVGSGEALRRAEMGDVHMVFVHAPSLEAKYIEKGIISNQVIFAYNYFIIAGPPNDPAGIRDINNATEAFKKIFKAGEMGRTVFVSRGDNSGTHVKESSIWKQAGLNSSGKNWYLETGSGMSETLRIANERRGYVLTDISTFLKLKKEGKLPNLEILLGESEELINIYSAYITNKCSGEVKEAVLKILKYLSTEFQDVIANYGVDKFGKPLFNPAKGKENYLKQKWELLAHIKT
mgnify:CR=1 FL=1